MIVPVLGLLTLTLVAWVGAGIGIWLGALSPKRLELLVHAATGVVLGITLFDILPEAKGVLPWRAFLPAVVGGYALLWAVGKFVYHVCPSCAIAHFDGDSPPADRRNLTLLAVALGVHCALDGVAVVAGGGLGTKAEIGLLMGLCMHKLPEGLALGLLLLGAGVSRRLAMTRAVAIESLTAIGGLLSIAFIGGADRGLLGATFAIVGGGFLYLVVNAVSGALGRHMRMSRLRTIATQCVSCAGTGAFLWLLYRCGA
jgi:zinc transporter ZupT